MIAIFEREGALGIMFVRVESNDELVAMRNLCRPGQKVIGIAHNIQFEDETRVWSFENWVLWLDE